jgi:hypothetical protein
MFRLLGKDQIKMFAITRTLSKNGINIAADTFTLSTEQRAHIVNNYINTGKMTEEVKSVSGPVVGSLSNATLIQKFRDAEALQEFLADPVMQAIKVQADAFYAAQGVTTNRSAVFN